MEGLRKQSRYLHGPIMSKIEYVIKFDTHMVSCRMLSLSRKHLEQIYDCRKGHPKTEQKQISQSR